MVEITAVNYKDHLQHMLTERAAQGISGTLGSSIPCQFNPSFAAKNAISQHGRMEIKEGERVYFAGPSRYLESRNVVPQPPKRDYMVNMEAMRSGGATNFHQMFTRVSPDRVYEDREDSRISSDYEEAMVKRLQGRPVVLVNPTRSAIHRFSVIHPHVYFSDKTGPYYSLIRDHMTKYEWHFPETTLHTGMIYYFGTNGAPTEKVSRFLSLGPNISSPGGFFGRSNVVEAATSSTLSYERAGVPKDITYHLDETTLTYSPSRVDEAFGRNSKAFFCWTTESYLFSGTIASSHDGRRFYFDPPPEEWSYDNGYCVLTNGFLLWDALPSGEIGTWCSRSTYRRQAARDLGLQLARPVQYGEFYVTYESDCLIRDPTVRSVDGFLSLMSSHEVPLAGCVDMSRIPPSMLHDASFTCYAWRENDLSGIATDGLPMGSGFYCQSYVDGPSRYVAIPSHWYHSSFHVWVFGTRTYFEASRLYICSYIAGLEGRLSISPIRASRAFDAKDSLPDYVVKVAPVSLSQLQLTYPARSIQGMFDILVCDSRLYNSSPYMGPTPAGDPATIVFDNISSLAPLPCPRYLVLHSYIKTYRHVGIFSKFRIPIRLISFLQQQAMVVFPEWYRDSFWHCAVLSQQGSLCGRVDFNLDISVSPTFDPNKIT